MTSSFRAELRELLRLSIPMAAAQFALITMGLVDTSILGRVSVEDLAGSAIGRSIGFSAMTLGMGVALALEPLASQAIGAKDSRRAWAALVATLKTVLLLWLPMGVAAVGLGFLLEPMRVEAAVAVRARWYIVGQIPGMAFYCVFLAGKTYLQARGVTRPTFLAAVVANLVNAVVCNVLVRGDDALRLVHLPAVGLPRLGALGAGMATSLASLVLAAVVLRAAFAMSERGHETSAPRPDPASRGGVSMSLVFRIGIPVGLQMLAEIGVFSLVAVIAGRLGSRVLSAHQVALGLASFTYMGALGVSGATAVRVGRAVGAGERPRRAGLLGIGVGAMYMCLGAAVFAIFPESLVRIFTNDPAVVALGAVLLRIAALFQLFDGVQAVAGGALRGAGDVRFAFVTNVVAYWAVGLPIAIALAFHLHGGAPGLWWGLTVGLVLAAIVLTARFVFISSRVVARIA